MEYFDLRKLERWFGTLFQNAFGIYTDGNHCYIVEARRNLFKIHIRQRFRMEGNNDGLQEVITEINRKCSSGNAILVMPVYPRQIVSRTIRFPEGNSLLARHYIKSQEEHLRYSMKHPDNLFSVYSIRHCEKIRMLFFQTAFERDFLPPDIELSNEKMNVHLVPGLRDFPLGYAGRPESSRCFVLETAGHAELIIRAGKCIIFHQIIPRPLLSEGERSGTVIPFLHNTFNEELRQFGIELDKEHTHCIRLRPDDGEETKFLAAGALAVAVLRPGNQYSGHRFPLDTVLQRRSEINVLRVMGAALLISFIGMLIVYLGIYFIRNSLGTELETIRHQNVRWTEINTLLREMKAEQQEADSVLAAQSRLSACLCRIARAMPDDSRLTDFIYTARMDQENTILLKGRIRNSRQMNAFLSGLKQEGFTGFRLDYFGPSSEVIPAEKNPHADSGFMRFVMVMVL